MALTKKIIAEGGFVCDRAYGVVDLVTVSLIGGQKDGIHRCNTLQVRGTLRWWSSEEACRDGSPRMKSHDKEISNILLPVDGMDEATRQMWSQALMASEPISQTLGYAFDILISTILTTPPAKGEDRDFIDGAQIAFKPS